MLNSLTCVPNSKVLGVQTASIETFTPSSLVILFISLIKSEFFMLIVISAPCCFAYAKQQGADITINIKNSDLISEINKITNDEGVNVSIDAVCTPKTFELGTQVRLFSKS